MVRTTTADATDDESTTELTAIAKAAVEISKRPEADLPKNPVEMAFGEASNDEDTVSVRFMGDRSDGVGFAIRPASLYEDWYNPDHIIAEHFGVEAAIDDAFEVLREHADLRSVRESGCGAFRFDRDTGDVVAVKIYGIDVDDHDATVEEMRACFDDRDD